MRFAMDIRKAFSTPSEHVVEDMAVIDNAAGTSSPTTWLEKKRRPKKINARYPFKVKPLIYATCAFSNLGNALFGYNSGESTKQKIRVLADVESYYRHHVRHPRQSSMYQEVLLGLRQR